MADIKENKDATLRARARPSLKARVAAIWEDHRVSESDLINDAVEAVCAYIEANGRYRRPIAVVYDQETADLQKQFAAEEAAGNTTAAEAIQKRLENRLRTGAPASSHASRGVRK